MNGHGQLRFPPPTSTFVPEMPAVIRRGFFAITFLCSILLWDVHGDEVTGPSPPLPMAAGKEITANLVSAIFWFDRLTTDPAFPRKNVSIRNNA